MSQTNFLSKLHVSDGGAAPTNVIPLQPRPPTTGAEDVLPLQPRFLPAFEKRETRSEPREIPPQRLSCDATIVETEIGLASVPAMAIGSSTEVLVSIVENQAGLRRNSIFPAIIAELKSPQDGDFVKSPSTEMTSPSASTIPQDPSCGSFVLEEKRESIEGAEGYI